MDTQNFEMDPQHSDPMVHDVIGRIFDGPEPAHRADLAEGAIAYGMAANRRRGFAVAGATLSVLAVVAGAVAAVGGVSGGSGGDWSLSPDSGHVSAQAYEDSSPNYADRQREIVEQLPGLLDSLLPAGMTVHRDPKRGGDSVQIATGVFSPGFELESGGVEYILQLDNDGAGTSGALAAVKPVAVTGGSIRMTVPSNDSSKGPVAYAFTPTDAAAQPFRFVVYGARTPTPFDASPIDAAAFKKMVEAPGFAKLRQLLDPSVPASAAAVRQRYDIEAKINAEAATVLPPGFRLKLSPGAPGALELVGPGGVDDFQWFNDVGSQQQISCPADSLCFAAHGGPHFSKVGPDGRARLGLYAGWIGKSTDSSVTLWVLGKPASGAGADEPFMYGKPGSETAPQGPGLTPQQAMAIVRAPGVAKVIADVQNLAALS